MRLKSCPYCGRIHKVDFDCGKKPTRFRPHPDTPAAHIRDTYRWQKLREEARERDGQICRLCALGYGESIQEHDEKLKRIVYKDLSVHHIEAIEDDQSKAFELNNLITLCRTHHQGAEDGKFPKEFLKEIISGKNPGHVTS